MLEAQRVCRFIEKRLTADNGVGGVHTLVGGRIYRDRLPQGKPRPAVTIAVVNADDFNSYDGAHVSADIEIDVAVRGDGEDYAPFNTIAARVFTVLQEASGVEEGVYVVQLRRTSVNPYQTTAAGNLVFSHIVQTFFTEAEPA